MDTTTDNTGSWFLARSIEDMERLGEGNVDFSQVNYPALVIKTFSQCTIIPAEQLKSLCGDLIQSHPVILNVAHTEDYSEVALRVDSFAGYIFFGEEAVQKMVEGIVDILEKREHGNQTT